MPTSTKDVNDNDATVRFFKNIFVNVINDVVCIGKKLIYRDWSRPHRLPPKSRGNSGLAKSNSSITDVVFFWTRSTLVLYMFHHLHFQYLMRHHRRQ